MYGSQLFKEDRVSRSGRFGRLISPQTQGFRASKIYLGTPHATQLINKSESGQPSMSEFINQLQEQLRRLSPSFSFKYSSEPPLFQALSYINQSIDLFLEEKQKILQENTYSSSFSDEVAEKNYMKLKEELDKARETSKNLNRYEQLLKKKEEKLDNEKRQVKSTKKKLEAAEEELAKLQIKAEQEEKARTQLQKDQLEKIDQESSELLNKMNDLKDMKEKFEKKIEETTKHLKFEKESLSQLEAVLNENKSLLMQEQKKLSSFKIELEKQKWEVDQKERKLEESNLMFHVQLEKLQQEIKTVEAEKQKIMESWARLEEEKYNFNALKENPNDEPKISYVRTFSSEGRSEDNEREVEIGRVCEELESQVERINKDLEIRENALEDREKNINRMEKELVLKIDNFRKIESSLTESRIYFEELKQQIFPELEELAQRLEGLVKEAEAKKREADFSCIKLLKEIEFLQRYKNKLDTLYGTDKNDESLNEIEKNQSINLLAKELEDKITIVNKKTEELEKLESKIESERTENIKNAEFLKKAHQEIEKAQTSIQQHLILISEREKKLSDLESELSLRENSLKSSENKRV